MKKRKKLKATNMEIIEYWRKRISDWDIAVDWDQAEDHCWGCGIKAKLYRCHIIPASLGGVDDPNNLVLLCLFCHEKAPNVDDENFMWNWIKVHRGKNPLSEVFIEYECMYGESVMESISEDNLEDYSQWVKDFWKNLVSRDDNLSSRHFGHLCPNISTFTYMLRKTVEEYKNQ